MDGDYGVLVLPQRSFGRQLVEAVRLLIRIASGGQFEPGYSPAGAGAYGAGDGARNPCSRWSMCFGWGVLEPMPSPRSGSLESMLSLVFAVGMGLSLSTTAMVARRIGEKDPEGAAVAGVQSIALGLMVSLAIGVPCFLLAPRLLSLMGASPEIISVGSGYTRICLGGSGVVLLLFLNNAIFRGAGDAAIAMRLLWVSNIINLVLDPCLIFGWGPFPRMGVTGAALATFTGRSIGVLYQFYRLL